MERLPECDFQAVLMLIKDRRDLAGMSREEIAYYSGGRRA